MWLGLVSVLAIAFADDPPIADVFASYAQNCDRATLTWGQSLCGPILLVDEDAGRMYANHPDPAGELTATDFYWSGTLSPDLVVANTAVEWQGQRWAMIRFPLPLAPQERNQLLLHESFHRIAPGLGLDTTEVANEHLESASGRLWLQLELRALAHALQSSDDTRALAMADAWRFRRHRYRLFELAEQDEAALELNEGLAEYTAVEAVGAWPETEMARRLDEIQFPEHASREFAYLTGPAWGLLLDWVNRPWRPRILAGETLHDQIAAAFVVTPDADRSTVLGHAHRYGYKELRQAETVRETRLAQWRADLLQRFSAPDRIEIPIHSMRMSFDPKSVVPLGDLGTVYMDLNVIDAWGELASAGPAAIRADFSAILLGPQTGLTTDGVHGDDWSLTVHDGWRFTGTTIQRIDDSDAE